MKKINLNCGIYQIRNILTRVCYTGQSIELKGRKSHHWSGLRRNSGKENPHLQNSYNKHGKDFFVFEILIYCLPEDLTYYEQMFDDIDKEHGLSYNIRPCVDSNKGFHHSEETKAQISRNSATKFGKENPNYGICRTEEIKEKISKAMQGKNMGSNNPMYHKHGIYHPNITSEDTIIQIVNMLNDNVFQKDISKKLGIDLGIIQRTKAGFYDDFYDLPKAEWTIGTKKGKDHHSYGIKRSLETKRKISEAQKGKNNHRIIKKEIILKIMRMLDDGIFQKDIAKKLNISIGTIRKVKIGFYNEIYNISPKKWISVYQNGINNSNIIRKDIVLKIIGMLNAGNSQKNIIKNMGICAQTVRRVKDGWYNDIYDLPKQKWAKTSLVSKKTVRQIINLLNKKLSGLKIAKILGTGLTTVYKVRDGWYNDIYNLPKQKWDISYGKVIKKNTVLKAKELLRKGIYGTKIAEQLKVSRNTVRKIKNGFYDERYNL